MRNDNADLSPQKPNWQWKIRIAGTLLSLILLIGLLLRQDWSAILGAMKTLTPWTLLVSIGLLLLRHSMNTFRWLALVRAQKIQLPVARAFQLVFSGLFLSNFLPSMVGGDVVRIAGIMQESEDRVVAAASVIVDRLVGAFGMVFLLPFSFPLVGSIMESGSFAIGFLGLAPRRLKAALNKGISRFADALQLWLQQPFNLFVALFASWMGVFSYLVGIWILARGLGMEVSLVQVAGVTVLTYFLTIVPVSINGYGIRELAIVGLYTQAGSTPEQASALALISRAYFLLVSLPGAAWAGKVIRE